MHCLYSGHVDWDTKIPNYSDAELDQWITASYNVFKTPGHPQLGAWRAFNTRLIREARRRGTMVLSAETRKLLRNKGVKNV